MLMFLLSRVLEELGKAFEGYVIPIVVRTLQEKTATCYNSTSQR
jgi:hypothetical protein